MKIRWVAAFCLIAAIAVSVSMQWRAISQLRRENSALRAQIEITPSQVSDAQVAPAAAPVQANVQADVNEAELQGLRDRVRRLELALMRAPSNALAAPSAAPTGTVQSAENDEIRQLGVAASQGDSAALERLAKLSSAARNNGNQDVHREIQAAFNALAEQAGKGNETAFNALYRATRLKPLQGMATRALGQAAGMGNEKALEPLLDPERYLLPPSSCISALQSAAENGNTRAIEALAAVANDPKKGALQHMAAGGLEKPAAAGSPAAIDALAVLARSENKNVRETALRALENAAFKEQRRAADALRALGYQQK